MTHYFQHALSQIQLLFLLSQASTQFSLWKEFFKYLFCEHHFPILPHQAQSDICGAALHTLPVLKTDSHIPEKVIPSH